MEVHGKITEVPVWARKNVLKKSVTIFVNKNFWGGVTTYLWERNISNPSPKTQSWRPHFSRWSRLNFASCSCPSICSYQACDLSMCRVPICNACTNGKSSHLFVKFPCFQDYRFPISFSSHHCCHWNHH